MMGISNITVNGKGKSKEEIKKEILEQVSKQVDDMFDAKKKEEVKKEETKKEPQHLHILLDEDEERTGFGCQVEINGELEELMAMLVKGTSTTLKQLLGEDNMAITGFVMQLLKDYAGMEDEEYGEEEE